MNNASSIATIENNCIARKTKDRYNSSNFNFIMWLYENKATFEGFLRPELLVELDIIMNDAAIPGKKKKTKARKVVVEGWLAKMVRKTRDDGMNQCPVNMSKITYEVVGTYMAQRKDGQDKYLGKGTYCGIRSGIINYYTMSHPCKL